MSAPHSPTDFARVETDLAEILHDQYDTRIADLELTPGQRWAYAARSRESIARVLDSPRHPATRTPARRLLPTLLTAAAVLAVAATLTVWSFARGTPPAYAATPPILDIAGVDAARYPLAGVDPDDELARLADLARSSPSVVDVLSSGVSMGPGKTGDAQHVEVASWWLETTRHDERTSRVVPTETQRYVLPDGSIRISTQRGRPLTGGADPTPSPGRAIPVLSSPAATGGPLSHPAKLPLDPAKLRATLLGDPRECAGQEGYCLSNAIQALGLGNVLSPRLNSALLRTMIGAGDVRYAGRAVDRAGRPSQVFVVDDPDRQRQRLVLFDADTGAYNGDETVLVKDSEELGVKAPAVIGFNAVVTREWIPTGAVPPAD